MSGRTIEKSRVALIATEEVRRAFSEDRDFARAIVTELAGGFCAAIRHTKELKLRTSLERLAQLPDPARPRDGGTGEFELPFEKRPLGSLLGMTPENLSRAFAALRPYGVRIDGSRVHISDPADLSRLGRPHPLIDGAEQREFGKV